MSAVATTTVTAVAVIDRDRTEALAALRQARPASANHDRALNLCPCGAAFHAPVVVDVACPACSTPQAW